MSNKVSFRARLLAELEKGPLTLRQVYALAENKRSAVSRLSELRAEGLISDVIVLAHQHSKK